MSGKHILTNIAAKHILTKRKTNAIEVFLLITITNTKTDE